MKVERQKSRLNRNQMVFLDILELDFREKTQKMNFYAAEDFCSFNTWKNSQYDKVMDGMVLLQ